MKSLCLLGVLIILCAGALGAEQAEVELMTEGGTLQPSSTLEARFAHPMTDSAEVGKAAAVSPLVFTPALPGKFTWLSTRSGVYEPSAPPRLGTAYKVTLLPGLADASGRAIPPGFGQVLKTPPFQAFMREAAVFGGDGAILPTSEFAVAFNLNVKAEGAEKFFEFVPDGGDAVAAKVRYATKDDYFPFPNDEEDWEERWRLAKHLATAKNAAGEEPATPVRNRLIVYPVSPLEAGAEWSLVMKPGIESINGGLRIAQEQKVAIRHLPPFTLKSFETSSYLNGGRKVTLDFSVPYAPDVTEKTAGKFFKITPEVPHLQFELGYGTITIDGDFQRGVEYRLEIDPSLLSDSADVFFGERSRPFHFGLILPRVYLPKFTADQFRGGGRKFPIVAVNLQSLKIDAVSVPPEQAAQAFEAFKKYTKDAEQQDPDSNEPYRQIPAGLIKGTLLAERTIDFPNTPLDAREESVVDWNTLLGERKAGLIFLTVEGQPLPGAEDARHRPAAQALIQLTDLGVLWKKSAAGLQTGVFSVATGKPVEGASLALLGKDFARLASGTAGPDGSALLSLKKGSGWLVVSDGDDVNALLMGEGSEDLPMARFNLPINYPDWNAPPAATAEFRGLLFTDRPLYQPGETVHVKGILRRVADGGVEPPGTLSGILTLTSPKQKETAIKVRTDERGAFDANLVMPNADVGYYNLRFNVWDDPGIAPESAFASFQIQEYQPNAFETGIAMPGRFAPGESIAAEVSARYFFGSPVTDARVQWTLQYGPRAFTPDGFDEFVFGDAPGWPERKSLVLRGAGKLAKSFAVAPRLPRADNGVFGGTLTVEVTDQNQQTVTETADFERDSSSFYLGIGEGSAGLVGPGEDYVVRAVAVRPDGTPLTTPAPVKAELVRVDYDVVRVQSAGKGVSFKTEKHETVIARAEGKTLPPVRSDEGWRAPIGETVRFKPPGAGEYSVRLTARDDAGREVTAGCAFTVSGDDEYAWDYGNPNQIDLVADKPEYRSGETARILLKTPISGDAWVTVERGENILRSQRVKVEGNAPALEIPIESGDAPDVFVSVVVIRGAEQSTRKFKTADFRYGVCRLLVAHPMTRLKVEVKPANAAVQPGEEVETEVRVLDAQGAPAKDAEVTFFAVDDGILALTGYERPRPSDVFEKLSPLNVRTGLTLFEMLPEDPSDLTFANKGYLIGGGGNEGPGAKLRHNFPGTACWLPALRTDSAGIVRPRFTAPDALTRYRLVAVASAGDDRFGSGESAVAIRKPLLLLSGLGPVANKGDDILARAVVRNDTGSAGSAEVALELDATAQPAKPDGNALTVTVPLAKGAAKAVDFPVKLVEMGAANWKWSARMTVNGTTFEDHLAATLKVGSPVPVLHETYLAELDNKENDLLAGVNPQMLEGEGDISVTVSNTRLVGLREGARQLLEYPYGCAEQLASTLIPWIMVKNLGPVLPDLGMNPEEAHKTEATGVSKIFAQQTPSGGISYWPGERPDLFASAWAAVALAQLAKQGYDLPPGWKNLLDYLSEELRHPNQLGEDDSDRALALFALAEAGRAEPAYNEKLASGAAGLTHETRALLALAILDSRGDIGLVKDLLDPSRPADDSDSWFGSPARERAISLMAWLMFKPHAKETGRLTAELLSARVNGSWRTTQENAWALLALSRYFSTLEKEIKPVSGEIVQDKRETPFQLTTAQLSANTRIAYDAAHPPGSLSVTNPKRMPLYGETRFAARPPVAAAPRQDRGYSVSRDYRKIAADGSLADTSDLQVGDRVVVTLRVSTAQPGNFVVIDDPLPAILEAINPEFRTKGTGEADDAYHFWQEDYREIRADRVLYFCDHLPAGAYTFRYLARVRMAGTVTAPATKAEEMYRPERFGLSETGRLASRPADK